jgi:hypothetical protein
LLESAVGALRNSVASKDLTEILYDFLDDPSWAVVSPTECDGVWRRQFLLTTRVFPVWVRTHSRELTGDNPPVCVVLESKSLVRHDRDQVYV